MRLNLTFEVDGSIDGEGGDDVGRFNIRGRFDRQTSSARWTKAYIGRHQVEYAGLYCARSICGDWELSKLTGGFWIWPASQGEHESLGVSESAGLEEEIEAPLEPAKLV